MRVAIATDGGMVSPHFGRCQTYTMVDVVDGSITEKKVVNNPGHVPGAIPEFLHNQGVDQIVCGGMGARAVGFFEHFGIDMKTGVAGEVENVIDQIAKGTLVGGKSACDPGAGKGYGIEKEECDHPDEEC